MVGLAGESQNFDGNGSIRALRARRRLAGRRARQRQLADRPADRRRRRRRSSGIQPKYPGKRPPYVSSVRCHKSKIPDVNGSWAAIGPGENAP